MRRALHLIWLYVKVSVQNVAAYRFDLAVRPIMSILHLVSELLVLWTLYHNTSSIGGWEWQHFLVLIGVFRIVAGGIRMSIVPNMRKLLEDIREGTLDFVLLKPVNAQFLISIREFVVWRVSDVLIGVGAAVYGCWRLQGHLPSGALPQFVFMLAAGTMIVYSAWLMLATLCFWFVRIQNIEMVFWNVFEAGRFPINVYRPWVGWILTYIIPLAFITTIPARSLFEPSARIMGTHAPIVAGALAMGMLLLSGWFFRFGLRRYSGASA